MTDPFVQHTREGSPALLCRRQEGAGVLEHNGVERGDEIPVSQRHVVVRQRNGNNNSQDA